MKITGALILILSTTLAGIMLSASLSKRVRSLEDISLMLDAMRSQIVYTQTPVVNMMEFLLTDARFEGLTFIKKCTELLKAGEPFPHAWERSLNEEMKNMGLKMTDISVEQGISNVIGATDINGQVAGLALAGGLIEKRLDEAREFYKKYSKLYRSLGLFAGLLIALFLV